ncbi:MAG: hypothetical protein F6K16_33770 [Symploca sp. SIO2B6]|nr:hypothetical protein [Symploca sp. SIO2B6]
MAEQVHDKPSTLIRLSEIHRHVVLNSVTLEQLGRVDVLWMYPQVNRVLGIVCKPGLFGSTRFVFKLPQIKSVKTQVLVEGDAEETSTSKVQQLESLIGAPVWSDGGEPIGHITDCLFDLESGVIIRYLLVPNGQFPRLIAGFTEGTFLLSPKQIKSFSRQRVLIADEIVDDLHLYSEGIRQKLANMTTTLKQDYWDGATDEWRSLSHHVQSIAHRATNQFLSLAEKAKVTAQNLSQNLSQNLPQNLSETISEQSEKASQWSEDIQEAIADEDQPWNDTAWVNTIKDTATQKGRAIVTDLKDRSQALIERIETAQQSKDLGMTENTPSQYSEHPSSASQNISYPPSEKQPIGHQYSTAKPSPDQPSTDEHFFDESTFADDIFDDVGFTESPQADHQQPTASIPDVAIPMANDYIPPDSNANDTGDGWYGADPWDDWDDEDATTSMPELGKTHKRDVDPTNTASSQKQDDPWIV